jgi:hypothetical protein
VYKLRVGEPRRGVGVVVVVVVVDQATTAGGKRKDKKRIACTTHSRRVLRPHSGSARGVRAAPLRHRATAPRTMADVTEATSGAAMHGTPAWARRCHSGRSSWPSPSRHGLCTKEQAAHTKPQHEPEVTVPSTGNTLHALGPTPRPLERELGHLVHGVHAPALPQRQPCALNVHTQLTMSPHRQGFSSTHTPYGRHLPQQARPPPRMRRPPARTTGITCQTAQASK